MLQTDVGHQTLAGQKRYRRARDIIPGGTQLVSKRPEMFAPGQWPPYFERARGVEVTDVDGRTFIDMTYMGIGACLLGYADPDVERAVIDRLKRGSASTLNCLEEVQLAEKLLELHPWAEMVRYSRGGGEAMAVAVRIARACTRRDRVAFCGYHGWQDWYLAANLASPDNLVGHHLSGLEPAGVPQGLAGTALPFAYNKIDDLHKIVRQHGNSIAAIVMEPTRSLAPENGFLEKVRDIATEIGACLIFDEISIGFRLHCGGAHMHYGVMPDIAVFGKALANGIPMTAIIGRARVMQAAQNTFISSTFWTDGLGPVAAVATLNKMRSINVPKHIADIGKQFKEGLSAIASRHGVSIKVAGHDAMVLVTFLSEPVNAIHTLYTARMLDHGVLATGAFYPSAVHTSQHVRQFLDAADQIFAELKSAIEAGDVEARIGGPIRHVGFTRLA